MSENKKIAAIGEALWDVYPGSRMIGGAPANFISHIAQTDHKAFIFSRVGDDASGRELVQKLKARKVDVSGVQTDIFKPTGMVRINLKDNGSPSYECSKNVAFDDLRMDSNWEKLAPTMDVIFFGMLAQRSEGSRLTIREFIDKAPNALKIFDANIRQWDNLNSNTINESLQRADILKLNHQECDILKKGMRVEKDDPDFLQELDLKYDLKMAVLTLGNVGSYIVTTTEREFDPGYYISAVDTTGAGDAYAAGFVIKYLQDAALKEISDFANRLAAFVSTRKGATPPWTLEQLELEMTYSL